MGYSIRLLVVFLLFALGLSFTFTSMGEANAKGWLDFGESDLTEKTIEIDGLKREYWIYLPPALSSGGSLKKSPVLMMLHGGGGNAKQVYRWRGRAWKDLAEKEGVILVFPQGLDKSWNDGRKSKVIGAQKKSVDDVSFLSRLIDHVLDFYNGDASRVSVAGVSNGAMMTNRLACTVPHQISSIAIVVGSLAEGLKETCRLDSKLSVLILNGTADPLVPYHGGAVTVGKGARGRVISTEAMAQFWAGNLGFDAKRDGFTIKKLANKAIFDGIRVVKKSFRQGPYELHWYEMQGGGHTWPSGGEYLPRFLVGKTSRDIDASQIIWDFFKSHKKE